MKSAAWAYSTPEPPGPPGLTTSEPRRLFFRVAGTRSTLTVIVSPSGFE